MNTSIARFALACTLMSLSHFPSAIAQEVTSLAATQAAIERLTAEQRRLVERMRSELRSLDQPAPSNMSADAVRARDQKRAELGQLLQEIERRINEEGTSRTRYAPSSADKLFRPYYDRLISRVEAAGTADFPRDGENRLYGEGRVKLIVTSSGRIEALAVTSGSGSPLFAEHITRIIRKLEPFESFTPEMRRRFDRLVIETKFNFTKTP